MSAETTVFSQPAKPAEGDDSLYWLQGQGSTESTETAQLSTGLDVDARFEPEASEKLREDLRRRLETEYPLPWLHWGLND
jgi:hypothetical protein